MLMTTKQQFLEQQFAAAVTAKVNFNSTGCSEKLLISWKSGSRKQNHNKFYFTIINMLISVDAFEKNMLTLATKMNFGTNQHQQI